MKKALLFFSFLLLFLLPSCTKESPEPVFSPDDIGEEEKTILYSKEVAGIFFDFYNNATATIVSVSEDNTKKTVVFPETIGNFTLTAVGDEAFRESEFTKVVLPDTVRSIGKRAFQKSHITEIDLKNVTSLGEEAFDNCLRLEKVTLGGGLKEIPVGCFFGCSALKSLTVPEGVETVGEEAFASLTALNEISLPETLRVIDDYAFWNIGSKPLSITVPALLESLGEEAFQGAHKHLFSYEGENNEIKNALGLTGENAL